MGSNYDLRPTAGGTSDPNARIFQKMAELETRIMALESKRDISISPITMGVGSPPQAFPYAGGKVWMIGDTTFFGSGSASNVVTFSPGGTVYTWAAGGVQAGGTAAGAVALPLTPWTAGIDGSVSCSVSGSLSAWVFSCLIIEWPNP